MTRRRSRTTTRGRSELLTIERRSVPLRGVGTSLGFDAYHLMRTASWTVITLIFLALFLGANFLFALVLYVGNAAVSHAHGFADDYWFSIQTMGTIGYGVLAPTDTLSNVVATVESFVGILMTAVVTGVVFARFSTPSARVIFSRSSVVSMFDGARTLMFRMANARETAIVEATARAYMLRDELVGNEKVRRIYDLRLRRSTSPVFRLSWVAYHPIDADSPLRGLDHEACKRDNVNLVVTLHGIDDRLAATIHTRHLYRFNEIEFGRRFVDIFKVDEHHQRYLEYQLFHDTESSADEGTTS